MVFYREKDVPLLPEHSKIGVLFIYCIVYPIGTEKRQQKRMAGLVIEVDESYPVILMGVTR